MHLLICEVADVRVAWVADAVCEVVRAVAITRLPDAPAIVEGVVNFRGNLVPMLDLRARLALPPRELSPAQHFVFLRASERTFGCRVDRASDLVTMPDEAVRSPDGLTAPARGIAGLVALDDGMLVVHDVATFLSSAETSALDEALARGDVPRGSHVTAA